MNAEDAYEIRDLVFGVTEKIWGFFLGWVIEGAGDAESVLAGGDVEVGDARLAGEMYGALVRRTRLDPP